MGPISSPRTDSAQHEMWDMLNLGREGRVRRVFSNQKCGRSGTIKDQVSLPRREVKDGDSRSDYRDEVT